MTTTTPDAVEALATAWGQFRYDNSVRLLRDYGDESVPVRITGKIFAEKMFSSLLSQGFTITRTEPEGIRHSAVADYLKDDKGLRPAMSEADLEATAKTIATMAFSVSDVRLIDVIARDIAELAKKYRGS